MLSWSRESLSSRLNQLKGYNAMHDTALALVGKFFELYARRPNPLIVEIGSMNVNGTPRSVAPEGATYLGLDCEHGRDVDLIVRPQEQLPIRNDFADIVVSTSQMEHDPFFWRTYLEFLRILKPGGILYINAPSNGCFHRYPQDCWRFYPDSGRALESWGRVNGIEVTLAESFVAGRSRDQWNDFTAIFIKRNDVSSEEVHNLASHFEASNVWLHGCKHLEREQTNTEDQRIIAVLQAELREAVEKIKQLTHELNETGSELLDCRHREANGSALAI